MKKHSLTRQITSIVSILVAGAILLCWVLNTTLLPRYYMHNKKHVLMENYETISNASEQDKLESDEFTVTFDNLFTTTVESTETETVDSTEPAETEQQTETTGQTESVAETEAVDGTESVQ